MEISLESNLESTNEDIFKLDYGSQNYENNSEFKKFQNSMHNKYGKKIKLFKCIKDKILFYHDCSNYPFYEAKCPCCSKSICYFCSCSNSYPQQNCCIKKRVYYLFKVNGLLFFDSYPGHFEYRRPEFKESLLYAIVPFVNLLYFIGCIHALLFHRMRYKNDKKFDYNDYNGLMTGIDKNSYYYLTFCIFEIICSIFIAITLFVLNLYFTIIIIIISIPFKFYPMKYLFAIHHSVYYVDY